ITLPASLRPSPRAPALRASLQADAITVLNEGPEPVRDLHLTLSGDGARTYAAVAPGVLVPGDEVVLALDTFLPPLPPGRRPRRVDLAAGGDAPQAIDFR